MEKRRGSGIHEGTDSTTVWGRPGSRLEFGRYASRRRQSNPEEGIAPRRCVKLRSQLDRYLWVFCFERRNRAARPRGDSERAGVSKKDTCRNGSGADCDKTLKKFNFRRRRGGAREDRLRVRAGGNHGKCKHGNTWKNE